MPRLNKGRYVAFRMTCKALCRLHCRSYADRAALIWVKQLPPSPPSYLPEKMMHLLITEETLSPSVVLLLLAALWHFQATLCEVATQLFFLILPSGTFFEQIPNLGWRFSANVIAAALKFSDCLVS